MHEQAQQTAAAPLNARRCLQVDLQGALICACAATAANIFESWIGASSQGKVEWLTNDTVNMIQICAAAALACTAKYILS